MEKVSLNTTPLSSVTKPGGYAGRYHSHMITFGSRLREARKAANMTQQRLGDAIGVSKGAVSRWESDMDQPQFAMLAPLRKELRVSLDELICGESIRRPKFGVADGAPSYDLPDEQEWRVIKAMRRMPSVRREALVDFLAHESMD